MKGKLSIKKETPAAVASQASGKNGLGFNIKKSKTRNHPSMCADGTVFILKDHKNK